MLKSALASIVVIVAGATGVRATDPKGVVCLGENLAKVSEEHTDRLYLRVDRSREIYFPSKYDGPKVVLDDLDPGVDHFVKVYFDGRLVQSWKLNFTRLKTNTVVVWRAAGGWRTEPCERCSCSK